MKEVLLSYRLLFGDDKASRKLYRTRERSKATTRSGVEDEPVLDSLCGLETREYSFLSEMLAPVRVSYSVTNDFPLLGGRLLEVQEYIAAQRPSRLSSLWRDRRDLLSWYTFWMVLFFGAVSLLCSILQVALGAAQVFFAYKSYYSPVEDTM
jgi:hypothetical protein